MLKISRHFSFAFCILSFICCDVCIISTVLFFCVCALFILSWRQIVALNIKPNPHPKINATINKKSFIFVLTCILPTINLLWLDCNNNEPDANLMALFFRLCFLAQHGQDSNFALPILVSRTNNNNKTCNAPNIDTIHGTFSCSFLP